VDSWDSLMSSWGICIDDEDPIGVCGATVVTWEFLPLDSTVFGVPPKDPCVARFETVGKMIELPPSQRARTAKRCPAN